jgi:hypothetical protein
MLRTRIPAAPVAASLALALALGLSGALVTTTSASADTFEAVTESSALDTPESNEKQTCSPADAEPGVDCLTFQVPAITFVDVSASALQPNCSAAGSYTLSATSGVVWKVNGVETDPGSYSAAAGTSVSVEATPYLGGFTDDVRTTWAFDFVAPTACSDGIDLVRSPTALSAEAQVPIELPTLAVTGASEQTFIGGLIALVLILTGAGMVVARRRAEV